jgi:hypothetical protein
MNTKANGKSRTKVIILAGISIASLSGCGTLPSYNDLGSGYVDATYTHTSWEESASRSELRYKAGWRTIKIWPSMDGVRPVVKNGIVVFVGMVAFDPALPDEPKAVMRRLFAVKSPDLPLNDFRSHGNRLSQEREFASDQFHIVYPLRQS